MGPRRGPFSFMPPLSFYIHFPWCLKKCPYCDFNSHEVREGIPEAAYLDALQRDFDAALPMLAGRPVQSVFIGGGTPSLLSAAAIRQILGVSPRLTFPENAEVTLEANPGAIEAAKFAAFREAGVTRLSLGIQSFDDAKLAALGRIHTADEARRAIDLALRHFERVNLDLMYGLPGQTLEEASRDIEAAIAFGPGHISAYHLTVEPNTAFYHALPPDLPDTDLAADMQETLEATLGDAGYAHYETSAFAKPGQQCRHNLNYWNFGDYLGIGAGAHSKITTATGIQREARPRGPNDYLADPESRRWQPVARDDLPGEFMMNALRLIDGFPPPLFEACTGMPLDTIEGALRRAEVDGLLLRSTGRIAPTPLGQRFLNRLIGSFLI